ncbi:uncharacterized protein SAPINGB_P004928 [Magnusiomyces paraingens]|uniref:DJ-1/PfpI domain-containing protein n=1 Tax=Magnusiomyces paraingens TaxID=2606893 RepID=A0A5E8C527_9ASCO|nr:uncharacterized protein SAPINGB_P004928 [Saprochaete ingens]VVT56276.1 unnamed protein product [Saprochaete ingens]
MLRSSSEMCGPVLPMSEKKGSVSSINSELSLEELNIPEATLHYRIVAMYTRDDDMKLLFCEGKYDQAISDNWAVFADSADEHVSSEGLYGVTQRYLSLTEENATPGLLEIFKSFESSSDNLTGCNKTFRISELKTKNQHRGIIMVDGPMNEFEVWFEALLLSEAQLDTAAMPIVETPEFVKKTAEAITNLFDREMRNVTHDDMWATKGRAYFTSRIEFFVSRRATIEACLPAFPCKSSNTMKVAGSKPDKGEELALRRLLAFSKMVRELYEPGLKIWIVSDGHVFSDCIGVDDSVVDRYGAELKTMYRQITKEDTIGFRSLPELFTSRLGAFKKEYTENVVLLHYLNSEIKPDAEVCREILMCGCSTDPSILRSMIDANDAAKIALYRGFSRFMFEDLAEQPSTLNMSSKARKKLASKVAFEMIKRNEAYSNLVGLVLPYHLRLSIHAHNNSGPKFGIRLLSHDKVRTVKSLSLEELQSSDDLLHIPTPWHNCVVDLEGKECYYVVKSKVVKDAMATQDYAGEWVEGTYGEGGRFHLMHVSGGNEDFSEMSSSFEMSSGAANSSDSEYPSSVAEEDIDTESSAGLLTSVTKQLAGIALNGEGRSNYKNNNNNNHDNKAIVPKRYGVLFDVALRLGDIMSVMEALSLVHEKYQSLDIMLIACDKNAVSGAFAGVVAAFGNIPLYCVEEAPKFDVLVVPGTVKSNGRLSCKMCKFINEQHEQVMHVFGAGSGSFILSKAGVLDGLEASVGEKRKMVAMRSYENVAWVNKPWVRSANVWTSSNASSTMDALFAFIAEVYGDDIGCYVSSSMGY